MSETRTLKNLATALNKAQSELGTVVKGSDNPYYKSKYADINDVIKTIKETLNKNGITYLQPVNVTQIGQNIVDVVDTILLHESGESLSSRTRIVTAPGSDAQKFGAAITYSRRFALQSIVGLPAEDDDGNIASGKTLTAKDVKKPEASKKVAPKTVAKKNTSWT